MFPSQVKTNQNEPPVAFRCSSPEAKRDIQRAAKQNGQSVNAFLRELVENRVAQMLDAGPDAGPKARQTAYTLDTTGVEIF